MKLHLPKYAGLQEIVMDFENIGPAMAQSGLQDQLRQLQASTVELEKNGGSAFPLQHKGVRGEIYSSSGMSLRDWFAGQAMVALLSADKNEASTVAEYWSTRSYGIADAMLAEREKKR